MSGMRAAVATAIVCAVAWTSVQLGAQDNAARESRDRAEIDGLMWRYARALDTLNPDAYAAAYTPDGQFGTGPNATKGRKCLRRLGSSPVLAGRFGVR